MTRSFGEDGSFFRRWTLTALMLLIALAAGACSKPTRSWPGELMRLLADDDAILETINDPASLEQAKPKLLARTKEYTDWAAAQPQEVRSMGGSEQREFLAAMKRHDHALNHAYLVRGAREFWEQQLYPSFRKAVTGS